MNILYILDNNFVPQVAAGICSVCENNKRVRNICFYIMSLHISEENEKKLEEFVSGYSDENVSRRVVFIELDEIDSYFDYQIDTEGWNPIVLARLLLDRFLPETVRRIIYLDGDTIVRRSLVKLWTTDMGDCSVGAAIEPTCSHKRKESLGLKGMPYYNAGILLIDMDNWRKNQTGEELIRYYGDNGGHLFANDQDCINGALKGRICTISPTYNYHNTYDIYRYGFYGKYMDYPFMSREELGRIRRNPVIIHFLGEDRPWRKGNTHRFGKEYLWYLKQTPWKDTPMETGWERYFVCWRIFNALMKPFPMLRCYIINRLMLRMLKNKHKNS